MICEKCGKEFSEDWRKDEKEKLKNPMPRFCSRSCANSRKFTKETNSLKSLRSKEAWKKMSAEKREEKAKKYRESCRKTWLKKPVKLDTGLELDITNGELEEYKKEHFVCELCGKEEIARGKNNLSRDHQHGTNHFRGLLCSSCNYKLGWFENRKEEILNYLDERNLS